MPTSSMATVVAMPSAVTEELDRALCAGGFAVSHVTPEDAVICAELGEVPDLLLVSAGVGLPRLARLCERFASGGQLPSTVVFPDDNLDQLESCVRGGFDYVMPPFRPDLLRSRMSSCLERSQLANTVREMTRESSLRDYERELSIAHEIQAGFLPDVLPVITNWEIATEFRPAKQVGGDFYDVFELVGGRRLGFVVADVCDKGVGAALFMALIRTLLRHTAEHAGTPERLDTAVALPDGTVMPGRLSLGAGPLVQAIDGTNRYMARNHLRQGYFATMFFGVLDPTSGAVLYINGGHNPPILARADGSYTLLPPTGPAVGILEQSDFRLGQVEMAPGDTLFVYTDGVVEARDRSGGLLGLDETLSVVTGHGGGALDLVRRVDNTIRTYSAGAEQFDDITMLALRRAV